jgi:hypothetical protein
MQPSKILSLLSVLALCYILLLITISYTNFQSQIFNFFGELITIPVITFIVANFLFSTVKLLSKYKSYAINFGINFFSIALMIVITVIQI